MRSIDKKLEVYMERGIELRKYLHSKANFCSMVARFNSPSTVVPDSTLPIIVPKYHKKSPCAKICSVLHNE